MSSSRVDMTLTGAFTDLAISTASRMKSDLGVARRPKPPPRRVVWIWTCSGLSPATSAAAARSMVWNWVPVQISQESGRRSTTQLSGSIIACAR